MTGRVLVVGSLNVDLVTRVARHPRPGETVLGDGLRRLPGGKGANQALAAARAGAEVSLVGCVGDDDVGQAYLDGLEERGVDTEGVVLLSEAPTGHALIVVDDAGENTIVVVGGANALTRPTQVSSAITGTGTPPDVMLLQLELPLPLVLSAAASAREAGVRVVLNPSPWAEPPARLLACVDVLVVNEHEAAELGGLEELGGCELVVTRGAAGATWTWDGCSVSSVPPAVDVVDTTGAGDVLAGALAAGLAAPSPLDRQAVLDAAVAAAAASVQVHGAQGWEF
ncbi:MAG TPA: PfkB family carbohydrate kinase [Motilibacteraceae bacterium]|nr:PfkB family carbohydrate kinase [Motilibacteraceae bacterium]